MNITVRQQIEGQFLRRLIKNLRANGCEVTPAIKELLKGEMRSAATVGACEERQRTLEVLSLRPNIWSVDLRSIITSRGVLEVLGYDNEQGGKEI